ncbi:hypothetical protein [Aeromonas sobria]|uniref:hypothetical protein n=1 Tax=Aeromonas sobria TaxID=646 RepID=UPI003F2F21EA
MLYDKKIYINRKINSHEMSIIKKISHCISENEIVLPEIEDCQYIVYTYTDTDNIESNEKVNSKVIDLKNSEGFVSCDVFVFISDKNPIRINFKKTHILSVELNCHERLHYKYKTGTTNKLAIYFSYSRLVEKALLHNELIKQINPRTSDHILVISNNFGHWGTASLFDNNGNLIISDVVNLINSIANKNDISDIVFIGGSQGATASLIYSNFFNNCSAVHAASPVPLDYKNQLQHMVNKIKPDDLIFIEHLLHNSVKIRNIIFYTSLGDHYINFVKKLFSESHPLSELKIIESQDVKHGDVLRAFIKEIYKCLT